MLLLRKPQTIFSMNAFRRTGVLASILLAGIANAQGTVLLEDDFDDNSLDTSKWTTILTNGNASIAEQNQRMEMRSKPFLIANEDLDPDAVGGLRITGTYEFVDSGFSGEYLALILRTDAVPGPSPYYEPNNGLRFRFGYLLNWWGGNGVSLGSLNTEITLSDVVSQGEFVGTSGVKASFEIVDLGGQVSMTVTDVANASNTATVQATIASDSSTSRRVCFFNRERQDGVNPFGYLDDIVVEALLIDCNENGIPDSDDIASGNSSDCDADGAPDECEIADDPSLDLNSNGILDVCECVTANYCTASPNTAGPGCTVGWQGALKLSSNNFMMTATGAPPLQLGVFFYGANQTQAPLGEGQLCVAAPVQRLQPPILTDQQGNAMLPINFTMPPVGSGPFAVTPFSTWNFQFWYRDPLGGPAGFNFSDGLEVTFCP
jgi:hypothetical protein